MAIGRLLCTGSSFAFLLCYCARLGRNISVCLLGSNCHAHCLVLCFVCLKFSCQMFGTGDFLQLDKLYKTENEKHQKLFTFYKYMIINSSEGKATEYSCGLQVLGHETLNGGNKKNKWLFQFIIRTYALTILISRAQDTY